VVGGIGVGHLVDDGRKRGQGQRAKQVSKSLLIPRPSPWCLGLNRVGQRQRVRAPKSAEGRSGK
jgi:hypothetical protein